MSLCSDFDFRPEFDKGSYPPAPQPSHAHFPVRTARAHRQAQKLSILLWRLMPTLNANLNRPASDRNIPHSDRFRVDQRNRNRSRLPGSAPVLSSSVCTSFDPTGTMSVEPALGPYSRARASTLSSPRRLSVPLTVQGLTTAAAAASPASGAACAPRRDGRSRTRRCKIPAAAPRCRSASSLQGAA